MKNENERTVEEKEKNEKAVNVNATLKGRFGRLRTERK